jgi:cation transport ATPase
MVFTFALWSYDVYGVDASHPAAATFVSVLRYLALLFAVPVLVLLGGPIVDSALHQLRSGTPTSDLLLITGVLAAFVYSLLSVVRGTGDVYFETACMILIFVTLGRWFEAAGRHHATAALDRLQRLIPETVHAIRNGAAVDVPVGEVQAGDDLEVRPGERIPTDAVIRRGQSIDEQLFTGGWPVVKEWMMRSGGIEHRWLHPHARHGRTVCRRLQQMVAEHRQRNAESAYQRSRLMSQWLLLSSH